MEGLYKLEESITIYKKTVTLEKESLPTIKRIWDCSSFLDTSTSYN